MKTRLLNLFAASALALVAASPLVGCGDSGDGPILYDEEKLQKYDKGRGSYDAAMKGGTPPSPNAPLGN